MLPGIEAGDRQLCTLKKRRSSREDEPVYRKIAGAGAEGKPPGRPKGRVRGGRLVTQQPDYVGAHNTL